MASVSEIGDVSMVISLDGNEETAGVFDTLGRQPLEDRPLVTALPGRGRIGFYVPSAAVQQPVIAAGGTRIDVLFLNQDATDAAKRQIPGQPRTGGAATDDQHLRFQQFFHQPSEPTDPMTDPDMEINDIKRRTGVFRVNTNVFT